MFALGSIAHPWRALSSPGRVCSLPCVTSAIVSRLTCRSNAELALPRHFPNSSRGLSGIGPMLSVAPNRQSKLCAPPPCVYKSKQ